MLILRWIFGVLLKGKGLVSLILVLGLAFWVSRRPQAFQDKYRITLGATVLLPVQAAVDQFRFRLALKQQIGALQMENAQLSAENARLGEDNRQAKQFEALLGLRPSLSHPVVAARVVSRNPLRLGGIWVLDAGREKGLAEGMVAITAKGIVGRILSVGSGVSLMQALGDPDCRIAVLSSRSRHPGIVLSPDGQRILVEYSVTSDLRIGDTLLSWGAGGIFPKGLPVGRVKEILPTSPGVLRQSRVVPFQNPWDAQEVFVLLRAPIHRIGGDALEAVVTQDSSRLDSLGGRP